MSSSIRQRERDQKVAPQPPQFASNEAAKAVLGDNQARYIHHQRANLDALGDAQRKREARVATLAQIARLQEDVKRLEGEIERADYTAREQQDKADGYGLVLTTFGQQLPPVSPTPLPQNVQGDLGQQIANWSGPETGSFPLPDPFADNQHDGHCINCGKQVWKAEGTPRGATHGYGPTCDPNNPESTYADLGNPPAGGAQ